MHTDRDVLIQRLNTDLVGPLHADEVLDNEYPSDVYVTGILWPSRERMGAEESDRLDSAGAGGGAEDESQGAAEEVPLTGLKRPCSAGLSLAVTTKHTAHIRVTLDFGVYIPSDMVAEKLPESSGQPLLRWTRRPVHHELPDIELRPGEFRKIPLHIEGIPSGISLYTRTVAAGDAALVTVTVLNEMAPAERDRASVERVTMFQVRLQVRPGAGTQLVAKPHTGRPRDDDEERSAELLYRDCSTFAVGHTCSAQWYPENEQEHPDSVATAWLPQFEVPRVSAAGHEAFRALSERPDLRCLEASWLATASSEDLRKALSLLAECYSTWIELQAAKVHALGSQLRPTAEQNLTTCRHVLERMRNGASAILDDPVMLESFRLANLAIQRQHEWDPERKRVGAFRWWPFQLAFILLAAPSACDAENADRGTMDLLWFPTGGGKTEAYLGLIAMTAFYRRLSRSEPDSGAGVAAIMRYTLRLLTTQQFVRATALILSCESLRRGIGLEPERARRLGTQPFSIGLWLGGEATPNTFEDADKALRGDQSVASPEQLLECPCCHSKLRWTANHTTHRVEVRCTENKCALGRAEPLLPVWTVDTDVYRECPTLLIGTVDKFAQLPRRDEVRRLFSFGTPTSPDLIIQDELHLISGPLGTIAALYEMALDWLWSHEGTRPKVIGSTATIRRAGHQALALFNRKTEQFPPAAIDHLDSGFAVRDASRDGRLYVAVTTAGRSAKFTLQAVAGCLLQSVSGAIPDAERRDPYSTLVAYFNSLRELGGALVLMQDDVHDSIRLFSARHAERPRPVANVEELTSRRSQKDVRDMLDKLAISACKDGSVDAVLATSMLSVGVDIRRLGLMLVSGQPKMRSEYIQATSRVGRDKAPGLVVVVLNNAKPRDRSHYETFPSWHQSLYRDVEVTSVTPFASRARDRAMRATLAAMVRHGVTTMHTSPRNMNHLDAEVMAVAAEIERRATDIDHTETDVAAEIQASMQEWETRRPTQYWNDFRPSESLLQSAERAAALKALGRDAGAAWSALNNMRSVEPSVRFRLAERLRPDGPGRAPQRDRDGE